uniref:Antitoxin n=2 Tax=unclassified Candidatus Kentrum TaxID=2643149 RepID=A0A451ABI6_9GAMM|nr:MAG: prevent-host-death family protein [Candidatus Kentron sp. LPFa]VFK20915.1 MAG: prevent-host-death family protein [Candidatus Kentron sp. LPFa]VFK24059.1 MAG: prevent-host-death family protein [Candidatus Kentron sp. LPFa]VFK63396.1 MAG: prevent-host-death family protein [Candidatus Kentron sp. UNK]VFK71660.1 MAG: prevent-host-death family protein [Candidatus Kentron sp. UNK]
MQTWQLQEAKSRFSELVVNTLSEGPQLVTRRGTEAVVVMAASEFHRTRSKPSLRDVLLNAPRGEPLDIERSTEPAQALDLSGS